jgi:methyltransferase-like protein
MLVILPKFKENLENPMKDEQVSLLQQKEQKYILQKIILQEGENLIVLLKIVRI